MTRTIELLLVDAHDGEVVGTALGQRGYRCTLVTSTTDALEAFRRMKPGIVVMDHDLPDKSGLLIIDQLQAVPLVITSTQASLLERVIALKFGADDFIVKPYDIDELEARLITVRHRCGSGVSGAGGLLQCGPVTIDRLKFQAQVDDRVVHLTKTEYRLLVVLASAPAETVISRNRLVAQVWGADISDGYYDHCMSMHMSRLRRKLNGARNDQVINTVRGRGFTISRQ